MALTRSQDRIDHALGYAAALFTVAAITDFLDNKRRAYASTRDTLAREFSPAAVAARYRDLYATVSRGAT